MATQRTGNPTLRNGLIFGLLLGLLGVANTALQWGTGAEGAVVRTVNGVSSVTVVDTGPSALLGCVLFLALLALTFVAGMLTARKTGSVGAGTLTGFLAGAVGALVGGGANLLLIVVQVAPNLQVPADSIMTQAQAQTFLIGLTIVATAFGLLFDGGLGAGMGALGALIGANHYRTRTPPPPAYYPVGYPGYPGYPGMPTQWPSAPPPWPSVPPSQPPHAGQPPVSPQ